MSERPAVLLGWELGGGLSHILTLHRLAEQLHSDGFAPVLAFRDWWLATEQLAGSPFPILPSPAAPPMSPPGFRARSFADILAVRGFGQVAALERLVRTWQSLIDATGAQLVVADHSPSLLLAAYGVTPSVIVGEGFTVPPHTGEEFPALDPTARPLKSSAELLANITEVQRRRGRPVPPTLPGLYGSARAFLGILPELDCYAGRRRIADSRMLFPPPASALQSLRSQDRPEFDYAAYLGAEESHSGPLLHALQESGWRGIAYLRNLTPATQEIARSCGLELLTDRPDPWELLLKGRIAVHHGGAGLSQQALMLARPQLLFPRHLEQGMNARCLVQLGVGQSILLPFTPQNVRETGAAMMNDRQLAAQARSWSDRLWERGTATWLPSFSEHCRRIANSGDLE